MNPDELNVYLWRDGFHLFFPMRGKNRWRVIGILPEELRNTDNLTFETLIPSIRQEAGTAISFESCSWFSTYRISHRAAERFRDGRCFLLGDAGHIHSPMGGQGMNTGLQDAYNLAWKLALVVRGDAETAILDSYERERMPVAHRLLETTDRAFRMLVANNWFAGLLRTRILAKIAARAMTFDRIRKLAFRTLSQTGISYAQSRLSQTLNKMPKGAPTAGDRFPWLSLELTERDSASDLFQALDDRQFNLLIFGSSPSATNELAVFGNLLAVHRIPLTAHNTGQLSKAGIPQPSFYLLRPDGHVGFCGVKLEPARVREYLLRHARLRIRHKSNGAMVSRHAAVAA
jgi:hypothetical protein